MDVFMTVFRLLHIVAGAFWAGAVTVMAWFLGPAAAASGPAGGAVMVRLLGGTKYLTAVAHAAVWTIGSGIALYWKDSNGFDPEWLMSATGMMFTLGGIAGIAALVIGLAVVRPSALRLVAIARAVEAAGGQPAADQQAELGALRMQMASAGRIVSILTLLALAAMAAARHIYI